MGILADQSDAAAFAELGRRENGPGFVQQIDTARRVFSGQGGKLRNEALTKRCNS